MSYTQLIEYMCVHMSYEDQTCITLNQNQTTLVRKEKEKHIKFQYMYTYPVDRINKNI